SFSVALYDLRMRSVLGPFILGMEDTPVYRRESAVLREAVRAADLGRIRARAAARSREIVAAAVSRRAPIDVVAEVSDVVPVDFVGDSFGIPEPSPQAPVLMRWFQTVSFSLFNLDFLTDARHQVAAGRAGRAIGEHIDSCLRSHRARAAAGPPADDVL